MKRILSVILIVCFCIQLLPLSIFAAAGDHALKLELVKDTTTFAGKEVLRVDLMYKSGSDPVTDQMVNLRYDATKLAPLMINGEDGSAYANNFSTDWASLFTMNNYATPGPIPAVTTPSEVVFYTTIQSNVGYICWKVTEKGTPPAFADFTRVSSIFFGLKEGVSFTALPDDALTFSNLAEDSVVTNQVTTVAITSSSTSFVWGSVNGENTLTVEPELLSGDGVTIVSGNTSSAAPKITTQPQTSYYFTDETATALSVVAESTDGGTLSYQWYSNTEDSTEGGTRIDGATESTYLPSIGTEGSTYYYVEVTNTKTGAQPAKVTSDVIKVAVTAAVAEPTINTQPVEAEYALGADATALTVAASITGGGTLSYQWYSNTTSSTDGASAISNATTASYTPSTKAAGTTYYYVVVTNTKAFEGKSSVKTATSTIAAVTVKDVGAPTITGLPQGAEYFQNTENPAALSVTASSVDGGTLSYQWYHRAADETTGTAIDGAIDKTYADISTATVGSTYYYVVVTNTLSVGGQTVTKTVKSDEVEIRIVELAAKPTITTEPVGATYWQGDAADALAPVIGDPKDGTLTYQWYSNTEKSNTDGTLIEGATLATYIPSTENVGTTYYYLVVTNTKTINGATSTATATSLPVAIVVEAKAVKPVIKTQPVGGSYTIDQTATALAVEVEGLTDGGELSYQWYANNAKIEGATESSYTPATGSAGTTSYYVIVTNTKISAAGTTTATAQSDSVDVIVSADPAFAAAMTKLAGAEVDVAYKADEDAVLNAVKAEVETRLGDNNTVSVTDYAVKSSTADLVTYTITLSNGTTTETHDLTVKVNREPNPSIALVDAALAKLTGKTFTDVEAGTTEADALASVKAEAEDWINDLSITVDVVEATFINATAGDLNKPAGTNGSYTFKIKATATAEGGDQYENASDEFTIAVKAKPFTDADRVAAAMEALSGLDLSTFAQTTPNDQATVENAIKQMVEGKLADYGVNVTVKASAFTAPNAGSASTTKEGTPGSITFTVTLTSNDESETTATKTATITATPYTGVLDVDAYNAAIAALEKLSDSKIYVAFGATDDAIKTEAEKTIKNVLSALTVDGQSVTVDSELTFNAINKDNKTCTYAVLVTKGSNSVSKTVVLTVVEGENPAIQIVAEAMTALAGVKFEDVSYVKGLTEETIAENIKTIAVNAIKNTAVTVDLINTAYTPAVPGTSAKPIAEQGSYTFTIQVSAGTVTVTKTTEEKTIKITANDFNGVSDEKAVEYAKTAIDALAASIAQRDAATADIAKATIEAKLIAAIDALGQKDGKNGASQNLTLTVTVSDFTGAEAGSAATTAAGQNGSFKLTVAAAQGEHSYAPAEKDITITATQFTGILDSEAVATAMDNLKDGQVIVPIRPTDTQVQKAIEDYIKSALTGKAEGVTVKITANGENKYTVELTKGSKTDSKVVTITWKQADPIKLATPENVVFEKGVATWDAVPNAKSYLVTLYAYQKTANEKISEHATSDLLLDLSAELQKGQSYLVTVTAIADGVYYVNSDESSSSEVYSIKSDSMYDNYWFWVLLNLYSRKYPVTAVAGEGGTITPVGVSEVQYKKSISYTITPDEGYAVEAVLVDGENLGALTEYTFKQVKKAHEISVVFVKTGWDGPFVDVDGTTKYAEAIRFVYENDLIDGVSDTEFAPGMAMTRAELVTVLGKMVDVDTTYYMNSSFTDITPDAEYAPYVAWAADAKIMLGYEDGRFGANDSLTIEQAAVVLTRYAAYVGLSTDSAISLETYTDTNAISESAFAAVKWIVESGIYVGENDVLAPQAEASRALIADMLYRFSVMVD